MGTRIAICIMAKAPEPGRVKTRLCPPLSPDDAAELYRCFLLDKIAQAREVAGVERVLAFVPAQAAAVFEALAPGFTLLAQRGADLTARLVAVCDELFRSGCDAAIVIDSDTPTLPTERLERAVAVMSGGGHDLVLGPSEDGGYYLIGLRRPHPELFEGMRWSTATVLEETERRARALGLSSTRLSAWYDVDTAADLARLQAEIAAGPDGLPPRHTRRFLLERSAWLERLAGRTAGAGGRI
ncbi:MAG TPA: TIGR04282 family arsenosugar biosynthesis glycosyltransferase [Methylomirabilota bacterium]|nr:TIGR04282 family arsenosugar biosynthesis glycosyltransferase [Methylomirabilota bacterium]